ncbi:uncharacterized protein [Chelonus insularis]|uniref:uncharacterized protein n=1 Tax=Chelonus insularis TaxID=460826 RepID=UPI00158EFBD3|nr:uncharacterized protein LOC118071900 [Chelonus insularis]
MEKNQVSNIIIDTNQGVLCTEIFQEPRRLTPTGKISHAKTRVYTQRYRKEWEQMPDFEGWLTSVPDQVTRAFCTYCKKNLHAHRLSLLKHTCTMKHQRAALMYQTQLQCKGDDESRMSGLQFETVDVNCIKKQEVEDDDDEDENEFEYVVERLDMEDEESEKLEDEEVEDNQSESIQFKHNSNDDLPASKKVKLNLDEPKDTLAQAMAHVHDDYLEGNDESNNDLNLISQELCSKEEVKKDCDKKLINPSLQLKSDEPTTETEPTNNTVTITSVQNRTIMLSTGKTVTLTTGKLPPGYVLSKVKANLPTLIMTGAKPITARTNIPKSTPSTTPQSSSTVNTNTPLKKLTSVKNTTLKHTCVSTHVLDTSKGLPIGGLQVSLYKLMDGRWTFLNESTTSPNGRCNDLVDTTKTHFTPGRYKLHFDVDKYFSLRRIETMFPFIEIVFDVKNPTGSYHIPILLTPFGYTTYRGVDR